MHRPLGYQRVVNGRHAASTQTDLIDWAFGGDMGNFQCRGIQAELDGVQHQATLLGMRGMPHSKQIVWSL